MKVLITGANGLLGQTLVKKMSLLQDLIVLATSKGPKRFTCDDCVYIGCDITDASCVSTTISKFVPDVIVNCAAKTNVDACETEKAHAIKLNLSVVQNLWYEANKVNENVHFIQISTDFVFDGEKELPDINSQNIGPKNFYGETKLSAENFLSNKPNTSIVRTNVVWGKGENLSRKNIVDFITANLNSGSELKLIDDQTNTPTHVDSLADSIISICMNREFGIHHACGPELLTPYEMGMIAAEAMGVDANIKKISSSTLNQVATRPKKAGMLSTMKKLGVTHPKFKDLIFNYIKTE